MGDNACNVCMRVGGGKEANTIAMGLPSCTGNLRGVRTCAMSACAATPDIARHVDIARGLTSIIKWHVGMAWTCG